jgi:multiple sugar transport system substrate-binding protein
VFNGSASLRDAAGQLIENVNKSVRRKQDVDADYIQTLYSEVNSLYRLDQIQQDGSGKRPLGELPIGSKAMLCTLVATWLIIGIYSLSQTRKRKNGKNQ